MSYLQSDFNHLSILGYISIYPITFNNLKNILTFRNSDITITDFLNICTKCEHEERFSFSLSSGLEIHKHLDYITLGTFCFKTSELLKIKTKLNLLTKS